MHSPKNKQKQKTKNKKKKEKKNGKEDPRKVCSLPEVATVELHLRAFIVQEHLGLK